MFVALGFWALGVFASAIVKGRAPLHIVGDDLIWPWFFGKWAYNKFTGDRLSKPK
jgi:hypothetical protein